MRILMIEDDESLCAIIKRQLEKEGFTVDICNDGQDGQRIALKQAHDLILLDRMLPSLNGAFILRKLRSQGIETPVLMMTALGTLDQKVEGLDLGADDYLVKPFAMKELLARVRAIVRRPAKWKNDGIISCGDIGFDPVKRSLYGEGGSCSLSRRETCLLEFLIMNEGQTLPREVLMSRVWGPDAPVEDGNLDSYIYFLRNRLKSVGSKAKIKAVRGVGYEMEAYCV